MLSSLQIENVAVIQKANVHFEKGLNVLTGETGAGKSILIDSINAILGNRTSKDLVRTGAAKAVIRAAFDDVPPAVLDSLEKAGYERSEALTLSREITAEGKSTCRINGMPATAAILRELCGGLINMLKRKYGDTVEDIIAFGQQAREELDRIQFSQERTEHLQAEKHRLYVLARDKAEVLTQTRLKAFEELNRRISGTLDFLNMPGVRMTLRHTLGPLASHGQDSVEFYISTNPGEDPKPLAKIASGGELSRITLAIKNAMADKDAVPTVIYDEIDSGVSGKAASRIGEVLKQSAKDHQILCITHTAQIAALADCHLLIQKNITNERTYTEIHPLDTEGRVDALAHIISGDHVTELSRANAREMLGLAEHETGD